MPLHPRPFPLPFPQKYKFTPHSIVSSKLPLSGYDPPQLQLLNPATAQPLVSPLECATHTVTLDAITWADEHFRSRVWSMTDPTTRFRVLTRVAEILREEMDELAASI
jgi:acyl-CoA reductase-like NAD-dependent aldehyde dehydrogenase